MIMTRQVVNEKKHDLSILNDINLLSVILTQLLFSEKDWMIY